jgi:hypothetical protein
MFCRFIFDNHEGEARLAHLKGVIDCPEFFVPDKARQAPKQCSFCKVPLCAKFCFEFFHRIDIDTEGNITGCRPPPTANGMRCSICLMLRLGCRRIHVELFGHTPVL